MHRSFVPFLGLLLTVAAGCGDGTAGARKYPVKGTVTVDGAPMADGLVYFKDDTTGGFDALDVKDGTFEGEVEGGQRHVEVHAFKVTKQNFDGMESEIKEELIAPEYNHDSDITVNVVTNGGNEFSFEVASKSKSASEPKPEPKPEPKSE